jgi:hypothetical protein
MPNDHVIMINISKKSRLKSSLIHGQFNIMNASTIKNRDIFVCLICSIEENLNDQQMK